MSSRLRNSTLTFGEFVIVVELNTNANMIISRKTLFMEQFLVHALNRIIANIGNISRIKYEARISKFKRIADIVCAERFSEMIPPVHKQAKSAILENVLQRMMIRNVRSIAPFTCRTNLIQRLVQFIRNVNFFIFRKLKIDITEVLGYFPIFPDKIFLP